MPQLDFTDATPDLAGRIRIAGYPTHRDRHTVHTRCWAGCTQSNQRRAIATSNTQDRLNQTEQIIVFLQQTKIHRHIGE